MADQMTSTLSDDRDRGQIGDIYAKAMAVMTQLRAGAVDGAAGRKRGPTYTISKAAKLVGATAAMIRAAEQDGRLPARERLASSGHRTPYSLADLNAMRALFGTSPRRRDHDMPAIIACQNFKGGVGKSTLSVHLAQYLAIRGYRVCLIDCDSQASATMMFGYVPDVDLDERDTLYGYFHDEGEGGLASRIRRTHFDGLDLIPANLKLYNLEYEIAAHLAQRRGFEIIDQIGQAVATIANDYDVVILDPPPALGMISLGVLNAANALIVPMPPSIVDFSSTVSFLDMLQTTMEAVEAMELRRPIYSFVRLVATKADESKSMHREILQMSAGLFGSSMLKAVLKDSAEIDNAISRLLTVYELDQPITSHSVHRRCVRHLDAVNAEIAGEIQRVWARQD
jgi:chromosome partitioning protein